MKFVLYTEGPEFTGDSLEAGPLGGAETAFIELGRELAKLGHSVLSYCRCPIPGRYHGVEFRDIPSFEQWRQTGDADVFVCSRWFPVLYLPVPAAVTVFWNHDPYGPEYAQLLPAAVPNITYTYCLSEFHRTLFAEVAGLPINAIRQTVNGVDHQHIDPIRKASQKKHKIMFTSRPERGLMRALAIYERLADRTLQFVAASYPYDGNEDDRSVENTCLQAIKRLQNEGYPVATGHFSKGDLYRHIAESKVVIYPCEVSEVFCIGAIEAQACGTVFLGTRTFGLRETATHPGFDMDDLEGFTAETARLLRDDKYRKAAEMVGLKHASAYSWENVARQFCTDAAEHIRGQDVPSANLHCAATNPVAPVKRSYYSRRARLTTDHTEPARSVTRLCAQPLPTRPKTVITPTLNQPLISCLLVTYDRLNHVKTAIQCFVDQTYENRELVIVTDGPALFKQALNRHLADLDQANIRLIEVNASGNTLGRLRNLALSEASGDIFCQWDDDDMYHPKRLEVQARHLTASQAHANFLSDQLQFHWPSQTMRWVDWSRDDTFPLSHRLIPGTIMAHRDQRFVYPEQGPNARSGEDSALVEQLMQGVEITTLAGAGMYYVYAFHGRNTYPEAHHAEHNGASQAFLESHIADLPEAINYFSLPRPYQFVGADGQALMVMSANG